MSTTFFNFSVTFKTAGKLVTAASVPFESCTIVIDNYTKVKEMLNRLLGLTIEGLGFRV